MFYEKTENAESRDTVLLSSKFGKQKNLLCGLAPVEDGVEVVCGVDGGALLLDVGKVGEGVDQAEQLGVVGMEAAPGPANTTSCHLLTLELCLDLSILYKKYIYLIKCMVQKILKDGSEGTRSSS